MKLFFGFSFTIFFALAGLVNAQEAGPATQKVDAGKYSKIYYVSAADSNMNGDGSKENPWNSITQALNKINDASSNKKYAVEVAEGKYSEATIQIKEYVDIYRRFQTEKMGQRYFYL